MGFSQIQVELQGVFGDDRRIAESAWTSSYSNGKKELKTQEDVERVVKMLGGSKPSHGVPFESVVFYFWLKLPISIDRQFMTHRIQSANGMSGRYRTMPLEWYDPSKDVHDLVWKCSHASSRCNADKARELSKYWEICNAANNFYKHSVDFFKEKEKDGVITNSEFKRLREFFRGVLPQNNLTERTTTMNLRSFANFIKQRLDSHASLEMQDIAAKMLMAVEESGKIPIALEVLKANGWVI